MRKILPAERKIYQKKIIFYFIFLVLIGIKFKGFSNLINFSLYEKITLKRDFNQKAEIDSQFIQKTNTNAKSLLGPCDISQPIGGNATVFTAVPTSPNLDAYQTFTALCTGNIKLIQLELPNNLNLPNTVVGLQIYNSNGQLIGNGSPTLTGTVPSGIYNFTIGSSEGAVVAGQTYYFKFSQITGSNIFITISVVSTNTSAYAGGGISLSGGPISSTDDAKFLITMAEGALPVKLLSFSGKNNKNENILTWQTSKENNFSHFEIERSIDAKAFERIGNQKSNESKNYDYIDTTPPKGIGAFFYRLKMIDSDGSITFSKIIAIDNFIENSSVGQFFPNPSNGKVFIDVIAKEKENWNILIYDSFGKIIKTETKILHEGKNIISLENINFGMNLVKFENGIVSEIRKVIR